MGEISEINVNDSKTSVNFVIAVAMWAIVGGLMLAATATMVWGDWHTAFILSQFSCMLSAVAAVLHIRCYAARLASVVRRLCGTDLDEALERFERSRH